MTLLWNSQAIAVRYGDADAAGNNDGTSWEDAFTTVLPALNGSGSSVSIWVAEGTYNESLNIYLYYERHTRKMYGGFTGTETALDQRIAGF